MFQIVDDLLDITSTEEQLGKPAGHDMVEGVYTLPVLRTLQAGGVPAMELLGAARQAARRRRAREGLGIVRANGGVASAFATAQDWADAPSPRATRPDSPRPRP